MGLGTNGAVILQDIVYELSQDEMDWRAVEGKGGQLESIQLRGMGPLTCSPTRLMSASAESGLWVSEVSVVTRDPVLWVSALLVSLVLRHLPLWLPTAVSSCKVERLFFGIPYEPRTTFPGAGSRPVLCVIGPGWIT